MRSSDEFKPLPYIPPMRFQIRLLFKRLICLLCIALAVPQPGHTQSGKLLIIRDAEIEALLRDYARPLFKAADLDGDAVEIIIVNDNSFNAFVADGRRLFVNLGTLQDTETPNELIGVLAHETGHIAGGHLARLHQQMASAQTIAIAAMMLGAGALAAGAASNRGGSGNIGEAGAGVFMGGQEAALRSLLSYQRSEEMAADRMALRYLNATGQSAKGMIRVFERLANERMLATRDSDPYRQSHPMAKDRVASIRALAEGTPHYNAPDNPDFARRHALMRAKVRGYFSRGETVDNLYGKQPASADARYARAHEALKAGRHHEVIQQTNALLQSEPNNSYFHELRGQALLESGQPDAALPSLQRAVQGNPKSGLIRAMYGQALLNSKNRGNLEQAIVELEKATLLDTKYPASFKFLAQAYGKKGDIARANLASAQEALLTGDMDQARRMAAYAKSLFPPHSPGWVKADDILKTRPPQPKGWF